MGYVEDLLSQARRLAQHEPRRPKQASLRRAVSTAYYALFHKLIDEAVKRLLPNNRALLRDMLRRAFDHGEMKAAAKSFTGSPIQIIQHAIAPQGVSQQLRHIAKTFVDAQEFRHKADYDVTHNFARIDVLDLLTRVETAFHLLQQIQNQPDTDAFLLCLLHFKKLKDR